MSLWCALAFLAGPDLPTEMRLSGKDSEDVFVRLNGGVWGSRNFDFQATRTNSMQVTSRQEVLASASLDLGVVSASHWVFYATVEGDFASGVQAELVGASVGYRDYADPTAGPWVPHDATIYIGPIAGRLDVTTPGFGRFDGGVGGRAGVDFTWRLASGVGVSIMGEFRYLSFKYKESIVDGNNKLGGGGYWVGAGLALRF